MLTIQAPPTATAVTRRAVDALAAPGPQPGERGHLQHALVSAIRTRHYSRRTEQAYWHWTRQFVLWSGKRHPIDMGAPEIGAFLTHLATERNVSASTQRQALSALLFLYREALQIELPWVDNIVRAKQAQRLAMAHRDRRFVIFEAAAAVTTMKVPTHTTVNGRPWGERTIPVMLEIGEDDGIPF